MPRKKKSHSKTGVVGGMLNKKLRVSRGAFAVSRLPIKRKKRKK